MLRYYMTPETRDALIVESQRRIAARAARNASRASPQAPDEREAPSVVDLEAWRAEHRKAIEHAGG